MLDSNGLNSKQQRIYQWINEKLRLPVYADLFRGAAVLLKQKSPGYVTFVAHAGRDIMNGLARTYRGEESKRVQYENHLDKIEPNWELQWGGPIGISDAEELPYEEPVHYEIPRDICKMVKSLIDEHKERRVRSQEINEVFFLTFLDYKDADTIPRNFMQEWKNAKNWFLKYTHARKSAFDSHVEIELTTHFRVLESNLFAAANSQYERIRGIDEILEEANR